MTKELHRVPFFFASKLRWVWFESFLGSSVASIVDLPFFVTG
jgi:hypothetical protein